MEIRDKIWFKEVHGDEEKWVSEPLILSEDDDYIYYHSDHMKDPRISSHTLIDLNNLNKYNSPGSVLLRLFGITKRSQIPEYQTRKGGLAETFAHKYLEKKYGKMADIEAFATNMFKDYNQFPEAAPFSGVLDLLMHKPDKMTIEVKSKEMKDYESIGEYKMYPRDQVTQGANQAVLAGTTKYMMVWVFLEPRTSKLIKQLEEEYVDENGEVSDLWIWGDNFDQAAIDLGLTEEDFKYHAAEFDADERIVNAYRKKAVALVEDFKQNRRIKKTLFKGYERKLLREFINSI